MMLQGLPIAAALFLLFPRLASPLWGLPADRTAATGLSDRMAPGSISELALNDSVAFRVDFDGAIPPMRMRYWRGPVLSVFNGREWRAFSSLLGGKLATGDGPVVNYTVTLEANDHPWLFALDLPSATPQIDLEPTRVYRAEDARAFLETAQLDDALLSDVDGRIVSAFVRAVKPS